jgi:hypothetical protein
VVKALAATLTALAAISAAVAAGCGVPTPLVCASDVTCGAGACISGHCALPDDRCASGFRYHESAGVLGGECTDDGSGSDGGLGGSDIYLLRETNVVDASAARDDVTPSCGVPGGLDVMFDVRIASSQRLYIDTYGTDYAVVLAIYTGTCASLTAQSQDAACVAASCAAKTKQWSETLAPGDYCVVADEANPVGSANQLVVRSKLGPPSPLGTLFNETGMQNVGSTCAANQIQASCNIDSAGEASWFFMTCGGTQLAADTCDDPDYVGYLTALGLSVGPLACTTGCAGPTMTATLAAPTPIWIVADDVASRPCSAVIVYVTLQ